MHSAEHLSRRVLLILRAVRKNSLNPSFVGLEGNGRYQPGVSQPLRLTEFDEFVTGARSTDASGMKPDRLEREETAALQKQSSQQRSSSGDPAPQRQRRLKAKAAGDG